MATALDERPDLRNKPLLAVDRCDRCGSQAYARATTPLNGELLFCGHHLKKHFVKLTELGAHVYDETTKLGAVAKLDVSPM